MGGRSVEREPGTQDIVALGSIPDGFSVVCVKFFIESLKHLDDITPQILTIYPA